jgi:nitroreductase
LASYSLGLGTCWVGAFKEEEVREILKTPEGIRPVAIIPVGYPDKAPAPHIRKPINQVVHYEGFP